MRQDLTDITLVVDRSGSMSPIAQETKNGIKVFIEEQRKVKGDCLLSLVQFDEVIERPFTALPITGTPEIPLDPRGSTALLDAIGYTVEAIGARLSQAKEADRPGRVMVVIVTDGEENASRQYDMAKVNAMIATQRDVYKWDFVFLGANQDAIATAAGMGISAQAAITYAHTPTGAQHVWAATAGVLRSSRMSGKSVASVGYSSADRDAANPTTPKP